jgi:hypothetical protein
VGLLIVVIGSIQMVNLGLKTFVFRDVDKYEVYIDKMVPELERESVEEIEKRQEVEIKRQREREFVNSLSMIVVGLPLYLYHWKTIQKTKA